MPYPVAKLYEGPVSRGATCPQRFEVKGVGPCVVKFLQNPQGPKAIVNELVGFGVARHLGLEYPQIGIVEVNASALPDNGTLTISFDDEPYTYKPGLHFYSKLLSSAADLTVFNFDSMALQNPNMLAGIVVLDLLLGNFDRKPNNSNLLLHREDRLSIKLIDLSMAFGSMIWEANDLRNPLLPPVDQRIPYAGDISMLLKHIRRDDFDPYLARLDSLNTTVLESIVNQIPQSWGTNGAERDALLEYLKQRVDALPSYIQERLKRESWWS